jgi:Ca-activated chloride channel family protein
MHFSFQTGPGIDLKYSFRIKPEIGVLSVHSPLRLGSLEMGNRQQILFELAVSPMVSDIGQILLVDGEFTFDIPSKSSSYRVPITMIRPVKENHVVEPPSLAITKALSRLTLYRMQDQAQKEVSQGQFIKATRRLEYMASHLLAQGENELAKTVLTEAQHIHIKGRYSDEGRKQIKYGTRALLLPRNDDKGTKA